MVSREEFKKKLLNLLNNSNLSKKLDKNTGESKGSPFCINKTLGLSEGSV